MLQSFFFLQENMTVSLTLSLLAHIISDIFLDREIEKFVRRFRVFLCVLFSFFLVDAVAF